MDNPDAGRRSDRRDESAPPQFIDPPAPHAGVGRALHRSFGPPSALPEDWNRLLGRLR